MSVISKRDRVWATTLLAGASLFGLSSPALAQTGEAASEDEAIIVTGSRIARQDYVASSPLVTVSNEELVANADITLETFLNTLPQVAPAATTSSNNPSAGGRATIDLRGLGNNRNIVLVDGRRAMVSDSALTVDLNTIPAAMIGNIEVITGGAGAAYGADAIAGAVNLRLRENFEGADLRLNYSNSEEFWDAEEYSISGVFGGQFADGRGSALIGFDRSFRQPLTKAQRAFSALATSTTGTPPEGAISWASTNPVTEAAVDALFATYGVAGSAVTAASGRFGFNQDGTIIFYGQPGAAGGDVQNFRDPVTVNQNPRFFPDFYSYNFDAPNALILPLDRYSTMADVQYETDSGIEFFGNVSWTEYNSSTKLAPTPIPSVATARTGQNTSLQVGSSLIEPGQSIFNLVVPVTNPFVQANAGLLALLNSRTGDDPAIVGSGATEPFRYVFRPLGFGAREQVAQNTVVQFTGGIRGEFADTGWDYELYVSEGRTEIDITQLGNIDTQRLTNVLANPVGTPCASWNPFGNNALPGDCRAFLESPGSRRQTFTQQIAQGYVGGDLFNLPAGPVATVFGVEYRAFEYSDRFLSSPGPFSGFNASNPDQGKNEFLDFFMEAGIPIVRDAPFAQSIDLTVGLRSSNFSFTRFLPTFAEAPDQDSTAYKVELDWQVNDWLRSRLSYQESARAPNFGELFSSSTSFPQIFDPCSTSSAARQGANGAALSALCVATGIPSGQIATFAATPGSQAQIVTSGNPNLTPETGQTLTFGVVFQSPSENRWLERLRGSIDYYNIKVEDAIIAANVNVGIASCFNYYGTNPTYSLAANSFCQGLVRSGGAITRINRIGVLPGVPANEFPGLNGGEIDTSGIDVQLDYSFDLEWLGLPAELGTVRAGLLMNFLLGYEQRDGVGLPMLDYTGTISFFGAGLGTSFPERKATVNVGWDVGDLSFDVRGRYIDAMTNRASVLFPGETNFGAGRSDVPSYWYIDLAGTWNVNDTVQFRVGVNNVANELPPVYAPNVQSGTDPSTYDVIGRRGFAQLRLRF